MANLDVAAKTDSVNRGDTSESVLQAQALLDAVFARVQGLGLGLSSVDLEIALGESPGHSCRVMLKVTVAALVPGADSEIDDPRPEFNAEGHHVIAFIAAADLAKTSPSTLLAVKRLLSAVRRDLRQAATFPDDIRDQQPQTKPFHFIDIPFEDGGPVTPVLPDAPHVVSKIEDFSDVLRRAAGTDREKADAISWLIHLFGDIHQPLHCIEHISDLHPGGDRGGNSFRLKGPKKNLHALWDSAVNVTQPKDEEEIADAILREHPRATLTPDLNVTDPEAWARTSFRLARTHAYSLSEDPAHPPTPGAAYKRNMERIGRRQAALAGYRLADRLTSILS